MHNSVKVNLSRPLLLQSQELLLHKTYAAIWNWNLEVYDITAAWRDRDTSEKTLSIFRELCYFTSDGNWTFPSAAASHSKHLTRNTSQSMSTRFKSAVFAFSLWHVSCRLVGQPSWLQTCKSTTNKPSVNHRVFSRNNHQLQQHKLRNPRFLFNKTFNNYANQDRIINVGQSFSKHEDVSAWTFSWH